MYGKYLVFPGEIIFFNILSYQLNGVKQGGVLSSILFNIYMYKRLLQALGPY